jgi:hypothetical protein
VSPIRASRAAENVRKTKIPSIGIASSAPERETALFTPEASPECLTSTEFNAVVVSGAMTNDIPKQDAAVEGGPPEAAGEAEYPEIFLLHLAMYHSPKKTKAPMKKAKRPGAAKGGGRWRGQ